MSNPNSTTILAASFYGLSIAGAEQALPFGKTSPEQRKIFVDVAGFLASYIHGQELESVSIEQIAAATEKAFPTLPCDHKIVAALFINITSSLR